MLLDPEPELVIAFIAQLALQGAVRLVDGGNRFAAYPLARSLRRHTPHLEEALSRITIARAFTCYQLVSLLAQTTPTAVPTLALDLLATFTDESVDVAESRRLLRLVIQRLHRLRPYVPVVVSLRQPPQPERAVLVTMLTEAADVTLMREAEPIIVNPALF